MGVISVSDAESVRKCAKALLTTALRAVKTRVSRGGGIG